MADTSKHAQKRSYPKKKVNREHSLKKRTPQKPANKENAIYVTRKTNVKAFLSKCERLFEKFNEVFIYCLGAAIQQGINLSLQLTEKYPEYQISVKTTTVTLTDDLEPLTDDLDYESQRRHNSALHICVIKPKS